MTGNRSFLEEELQVLESIYPDYILESSTESIRLEVPVELGSPRRVLVIADDSLDSNVPSGSSIKVSYLPPIFLNIKIPDGYPAECPPVITSIHATNSWLPNEAKLAHVLQDIWLEGEGVLCNWVELLRSGELLEQLHLIDKNDTIRLPHAEAQPILPQILLAYDSQANMEQFSQNSYPCSICFTSLKGARCIQLECSHVFCRDCLQEFWSFCIAEGSVERVGCADPVCVKDARGASEEEVRRVVSDKEVIRWKWLRTKKEIEKDPTIMHCPIPTCQAPVPKPKADPGASSGWDRFRSCASCGFNFCSFCKHTWHGPLSECSKSITHSLVMEYLDHPEGSPERASMEWKYGKGLILKLVKDYEEERSTNEWLKNSTTTCPSCHIPVEKSLGCNHMMCVKCSQHFCYRCGGKLSALEPYAHFSAKESDCYGQLFDMIRNSEEDGWQAIEWIEAL